MREVTRKQIQKVYQWYAPLYDGLFGKVLQPGRERLAAAVSARACSRILEIGVGTGLMLHRYPAQADVVGVDISSDMLRRARARIPALAGRMVALVAADAEQLPFADGTFDSVTLPYVLSVTPTPARLIDEVRRVCTPDGHIFVLNHFSGSRFWWVMERLVDSIASRVGFRSSFSYEEQIMRHSWAVEHQESVNLMGLSRLVVLRNG